MHSLGTPDRFPSSRHLKNAGRVRQRVSKNAAERGEAVRAAFRLWRADGERDLPAYSDIFGENVLEFCHLADSMGFGMVVREVENVGRSFYPQGSPEEGWKRSLDSNSPNYPMSDSRALLYKTFVLDLFKQFPTWRIGVELLAGLWLIGFFECLDAIDGWRCSSQAEELESLILGEDLGVWLSLWIEIGME